jgi:hypothetical protein
MISTAPQTDKLVDPTLARLLADAAATSATAVAATVEPQPRRRRAGSGGGRCDEDPECVFRGPSPWGVAEGAA